MTNCKVCTSETRLVFKHQVLDQFEATYYACSNCGYLFIDNPTWLDLAYSDAIASTDTGLVARNLDISRKLTLILYWLFGERGQGRYVDVAGGYGMLTRLMRDTGIPFHWMDKYCQNSLSVGFDLTESEAENILGITAMEVMEHVEDPFDFIRSNLEKYNCDTLIFTTELYSDDPPSPESWWYYSFETGQHIGFFQKKTFQFIANHLGLNFYTHKGIHILTKRNLSMFLMRMALSKISLMTCQLIGRQFDSLTMKDHDYMVAKIKNNMT